MASTLAASAYFLTCCRPIHNSFCFLIEKPKLINFYHYPLEFFLKYPHSDECKYGHDHLFDHNLNNHNKCTDDRSWSLDDRQKRQHFQDLICHRIPQCEVDAASKRKRGEQREKKQDPGTSQGREKQVTKPKVKDEEKKKVEVKEKKEEEDEDEDEEEEDDEFDYPLPPDDSEHLPSAERSKENVPSVKSAATLKSKGSKKETSVDSEESEKTEPSVSSEESEQVELTTPKKPEHKTSVGSEESEKLKPSVTSEESVKIEQPVPSVKPEPETSVESEESEKLEPSVTSKESVKIEGEPSLKSSENLKSEPKDAVGLTDELIEKLDRNLRNLESTFDKFVKKNRDFIQNLVECLDFEKQKQKSLEDDYNKLKQENEALKTQNDYLKMVNNKQLDLFKNELDRGISENKVIYKRKIHLMERQLQNDQNELQMYKQTEKKYMEVVEQDNDKIEKLNNKIDDLKNKEVQLVKNYLQLLKFLENVKNILSSADPKEIPQLRSLNTLTDSEGENKPDVRRVLRNALTNGISTLNVRDLSILHDAIEGLKGGLCHQKDTCTKCPTADSSYPDFSTMSIHRLVIEHSREDIPTQFGGYETSSDVSIDRIPTRQQPEERRVGFRK